jgi:peptidyl-prolyl cis-trans isomerase A (cyclophilin A)
MSTTPGILLRTGLGEIRIALHAAAAPVSVATFLAYLRGGHLAGSSVFRILTAANQAHYEIWSPTVQWGWRPPATGARPADPRQAQPFPPIPLETTRQTGLRHRRGSMSMARRDGIVMGTEYFIALEDSPELDFGGRRNPDGLGFAVFAQVVEGMETVDRIHALGEAEEYLQTPVPILSVTES